MEQGKVYPDKQGWAEPAYSYKKQKFLDLLLSSLLKMLEKKNKKADPPRKTKLL